MADKEKGKEEEKKGEGAEAELDDEETTAGGKIAIVLATIVIIIIWLGILVLMIKWDVGGFGSSVMYPILKDVPYLNKILPEVKDAESEEYPYKTISEATEYVKELEISLAEAKKTIDEKQEEIDELNSRIDKLSVYENNEKEYEKLKLKFDKEVVFSDAAPDINNYREYYESISPINAEEIYRQVLEQQLTNEELSEYISTYSSMKAKNAAAIFDTMTDRLSLVAKILEGMDTQSRSDILAAMDTEIAARLTSMMNPE